MTKLARHKTILELASNAPLASQEELQRALGKRGFKVGQATLSRDIHELGLVKTGEGYALPNGNGASDSSLPPVSRLVRECVLDVRPAHNLLVAKITVARCLHVSA